MKRRSKLIVACGIISTLMLGAHAEQLKVGATLPALSSFSLQGNVPSVEGKIIILDFWAPWCGPCKKSMPSLDQIYQKYKTAGVIIIGVCVEPREELMNQFLKSHPVSFPIVCDVKNELAQYADIQTMPTTIILDSQRRVAEIINGYHGEETDQKIVSKLEELLKQ